MVLNGEDALIDIKKRAACKASILGIRPVTIITNASDVIQEVLAVVGPEHRIYVDTSKDYLQFGARCMS